MMTTIGHLHCLHPTLYVHRDFHRLHPPSDLQRLLHCLHPSSGLHLVVMGWNIVHCAVTQSPETPRAQIRDNLFVRILTVLEEVKETQRVHGRMLQMLLHQHGNIGTTISSTPEGVPLKTLSDVEVMEEKLANPNFMSELVCMLRLRY